MHEILTVFLFHKTLVESLLKVVFKSTLNYYYYNHFTALWILSVTTWVGECFFWCRLTRVVPDKIHRAVKLLCVCTWVSRHQKGKSKTSLDFVEQETVSSNGVSCAICKSIPCFRQITTPVLHHSVFYRPDALPATQPERQSTLNKQFIGFWQPC